MTSSSAIHVSAGDSQIAILHDELRLTLPCRARLPEFADARNPFTAPAVIGSQHERACLQEHKA